MTTKTDGYFIADICLRTIPVTFHALGLLLLSKVQYRQNFNKVQKLYLIVMSFNELSTNVLRIAEKLLELHDDNRQLSFNVRRFRQGFFVSQLYMIMIALTIDRYLFVRMNIVYSVHITVKRTRILLMLISLVSAVITISFFATEDSLGTLNYKLTLYFWTVSDAVFLTIAICCYMAIKHSLKRNAKLLHLSAAFVYRHRITRAMFVPRLIILLFISTWIAGDIIYLCFSLTRTKEPSWMKIVLNLMYVASYTLDAVFYIFFCRRVRLIMGSIFRCQRNTDMSGQQQKLPMKKKLLYFVPSPKPWKPTLSPKRRVKPAVQKKL